MSKPGRKPKSLVFLCEGSRVLLNKTNTTSHNYQTHVYMLAKLTRDEAHIHKQHVVFLNSMVF